MITPFIVAAALLLEHTAAREDGAQEAKERKAVLAVMERAFDAVAADDPAAWRPLLTENAYNLSFRPDRANPDGSWLMRERSYKDTLSRMSPGDGPRYEERWHGEPTVLVHGQIAVVWGHYAFWLDGELAHCGVDTVNLAKIDGHWKIAHFMWTVEPDSCPPDLDR